MSTETVKCGYYAVDADGNERSAEWTEERPAGEMDREMAEVFNAPRPDMMLASPAVVEMIRSLRGE